jgi:hypothetical protein
MRTRSLPRSVLLSSCIGGLLVAFSGCSADVDDAAAAPPLRSSVAAATTSSLPGYVPPANQGANVPPPTLASRVSGSTPDGSNNDVGYCHMGYCINAVSTNYHNARRIKFNVNLVYYRNDPNLHQVLARAFHPYYVTKDENFSANDCIGGWRLCTPHATYDMVTRKLTSCSGMPGDCTVGTWTFQMLHSYLWGNQVAGAGDHCGDAEGNVVVIRVDPADPTVAYVWYVNARDDSYTVHASNLDFTGAHPQFANQRNSCGISGCSGSHHKQYARRTNDGDAHNFTVDNTIVFFHPGVEYDYKRNVDPTITCVMPYHGYRCNGGSLNEGHDNDDARCNRWPYTQTLTKSTSIAGSSGPWGAVKSGNGAFYGGYWNYCPLSSHGNPGWGIGLNASWTYGDSGAKKGHPKGSVDNTTAWYPCGNGTCDGAYGETCGTCPQDCGSCGGTGGSCVGACGGSSGSCWCDSSCVSYGDCCPDACFACGHCGDGRVEPY